MIDKLTRLLCDRPYKMVMHLLEAAVVAGVNLQTHTLVHAVSPESDSEGYWTLNTTRGATKAKRIVFASNGYTSGLLPEYTDAISPSRGSCARVKATAAGGPLPQISSCGVVVKSPNTMDSYWGARPDGSFIVGGSGSYRDKPELWKGNFDDASLIEPAVPFFEQWASKNLVGWEHSETKVENVWTGIMGVSHSFSLLFYGFSLPVLVLYLRYTLPTVMFFDISGAK